VAQLSKKLRNWEYQGQGGLSFFCPGCDSAHTIKTQGPGSWTWNGNVERPTFQPSVLVTYVAIPDASEEFKEWRTARACHSFVTNGMIQFLTDSTHPLAGQTVPLADFPEHYG
jgi:hypothetical protein